MQLQEIYEKMMNRTVCLALATSVDGVPNVRVISYGYEKSTPNKVYFTTFPGNRKVTEFEKNPQVSFILLPEGDADTQVRIFGKVKLTEKPLAEIGALIAEKYPPFGELLDSARDVLLSFEIEFSEAEITVGVTEPQILML